MQKRHENLRSKILSAYGKFVLFYLLSQVEPFFRDPRVVRAAARLTLYADRYSGSLAGVAGRSYSSPLWKSINVGERRSEECGM